jgi:hypothetical protein
MYASNRSSRPKYPSTVSASSARGSSYSAFSDGAADEDRDSGIVTTASTISLQRAAAQTKTIAPLVSPRTSSVEKSIGVTTRSRRSREASARSYSRASTSMQTKDEKSPEQVNGNTRSTSSKAVLASKGLTLDTARTSKTREQSSDESAPLSASTSHANQFFSPVTSAFGLAPTSIASGGSSTDLDPYSDAWGQNSTVAAERAASGDLYAFSMDTSLSRGRPRNASLISNTSSMASRSVLSSLTTAREVGMSSSSLASQRVNGSDWNSNQTKGKNDMLEQLLASLALIDSRPYKSLQSIEEVESYKSQLLRVEKRIVATQHKLKVEMRVRDAADKLRKTGLRRVPTGGMPGITRSVSGPDAVEANSAYHIDQQQAEAGVAMAIKRTDAICKELIDAKEEAMALQKKLLEHQTRTLALRVRSLEEEQAERLKAIEEDERNKVGANLAIEEVDKIRDKLSRVEKSLGYEKREREEEVGRWKKKYEVESAQWKKRQEEEEQKRKVEKEDIKRRTEVALKQMQSEHAEFLSKESSKRSDVEKQLAEQMQVVSQLKERQKELEQLELEMTAERNIMTSRQKLFVAFEKRLNRAETRLREQDDRCAQLLGKVDGREEMDNMLERIKAGYGAVKKEKTAGQDIDGLIDSITTHIGDLEDELHRAGNRNGSPLVRDDLAMQLEIAERELEMWRSEAEGTRRSLVAVQRQSTTSMRSRNVSNAISAEAEARLTYMEKKNAALEAELAEARLHSSMRDQSSSPSVKVAGGTSSSTNDAREMELMHNAIQALLCTMPALDPMCTDLRRLQSDLGEPSQPTTAGEDAEDNCIEVMDRSRALVSISTRLVDRALASEIKQEAFESELMVVERQCEDLRAAMEDLRRGNASHKAREMTLQSAVNELRKSLTAKSIIEMNAIHLDKMSSSFASNESLSKPSQAGSSSSSIGTAASRRIKGIPNPLPIARSNSNLSFTSSPRGKATSLAASTSMPRNLNLGASTSSNTSQQGPPRSMTLGMGAEELRSRVRLLETELIQAKAKTSAFSSATPPTHAIELQQELVRELDEHRRELDYVKGVESKQRVELLDELTSLTEELSVARAQLRAEQRKKAKVSSPADSSSIPQSS